MAKQNQYLPQSVPHPGETLGEKLEEMQMGPKEFAVRTGKPEKTISAILKGDSAITTDMAILFENVTQIPANFWINHQKGFEEYKAREKQKEALREAADWAKKFPIAELVKCGFMEKRTTIEEKTLELLSFFGFANQTAWAEYYFEQQLKVAFRISLASTSQPYAISSWLRMGELQAERMAVSKYSAKSFRDILPKIKSIMATHPTNFFEQLKQACAAVGVKLVHTPCLPKAPLNGATRWLNNSPVIQLTGRHKRNDIFWFTFFHEAGHILLHGKKDIFLEDVEYSDKDLEKEREADSFAADWTLTKAQEEIIVSFPQLTEKMVIDFANEFKTHPGIIIGRLQHRKLIPHSVGRYLIEKIEL
ncbi:ImmA/IrrE family metallo-endopeptidase [Cyclobacterium marinum]|uniref:ImmA/IrrE family metallo-endopeptidase n=1 Tax=Cyclobacterium marinum TaxID=104 RepID=UPI0011EE59BD|nr:ImmA/IrrE family metallo-endopeptidase [Cyclobacterium marinum]MBI0400000.1 ImmA/IrrE family metallo-endopeptidase [Cyclobacterium marinum]